MNIVLIGYRGTGKSVVAQRVAERLGLTCVGMDDRIVEQAGMSIPAIVTAFGWKGFRDRETELALALAHEDNVVIDTGGGVIERTENMQVLGENALVVWLKASVQTIVSRIGEDTQRPSLTGGQSFVDEVAEVLSKRATRYRNAAHHEIDTDALTPKEVADRVCRIWHEAARV